VLELATGAGFAAAFGLGADAALGVLVDFGPRDRRVARIGRQLVGDAFGGYRFRIPRSKINATVQLNVKNITNSYLANPGRYNDTYSALRRVYLNEPRSFRLTTTLDF
jgi:hypothetical protein